jgi:hypothetical protein
LLRVRINTRILDTACIFKKKNFFSLFAKVLTYLCLSLHSCFSFFFASCNISTCDPCVISIPLLFHISPIFFLSCHCFYSHVFWKNSLTLENYIIKYETRKKNQSVTRKRITYYRGHPKVNVFFYSLIFTLNHRRPKMSKFDTSDKKIIETIFF